MKFRALSIIFWLIFSSVHAAPLLAEDFSANNLVGVYKGEVLREFTPDFELIREIPLPQELAGGIAPCLLPSGNVALNTQNGIAVLDPSGNLIREIDLGGKPVGRTIGPNGLALAIVGTTLYEVNIQNGDKSVIGQLPILSVAQGIAPCLLPNGLLGINNLDTIQFFDLNSAALVDSIQLDATITGMTPGPGGAMIVTTVDDIRILKHDGSVIQTINIANSTSPTFLPNGMLAVREAPTAFDSPPVAFNVGSAGNAEFLLIDLNTAAVVDHINVQVDSLTVVPFRFQVVLQGNLAKAEGGYLHPVNQRGVLALSAGSGRLLLGLPEHSLLATTLGIRTLVLKGLEAPDDGFVQRRLFQGMQIPPSGDPHKALASVAVKTTGQHVENNFFEIKNTQGSLHITSGDGIFNGRLVTNRKLN